jgi:Na+-transporting NADH:ubiquinone oxidoreductase subunit C
VRITATESNEDVESGKTYTFADDMGADTYTSYGMDKSYNYIDYASATFVKTVSASQIKIEVSIVDVDGNIVEAGEQGGEKAGFKLNSADYKAGKLALYICNVDGKKISVVPVYGMGLWGPIWGYIAVAEDGNTIYGAYFNHEGETAGLGAEIKDSKAWQDKFIGKTIYDAAGTPVIKVLKSSEVKNPQSEVDAVTGATLTSNGVSDMLQDGFKKYNAALKK